MNTAPLPLLLLGGGGHCRSVINAALDAGLPVLGVIDRSPEDVGREVLAGVKVVGTDSDMGRFAGQCEFIVTMGFIGDPTRRIDLWDRALEAGLMAAPPLVAPSANVSRWALLRRGTVVLGGAQVNAGAFVDYNSIVNTLSNIDHDARVEAHCHVSTGAMVNGGCSIGEGSFIGSGAVLYQGVVLRDYSVVPAGTIVRYGNDELLFGC